MKRNSLIRNLIFAVLAILSMANACDKQKESNGSDKRAEQKTTKNDMQDHSLRFTFQGNYSDSWKKVDSLEQKGLYESALKEVDAIFVHALNEKNTPNVLRAVMYKMKYNSYME